MGGVPRRGPRAQSYYLTGKNYVITRLVAILILYQLTVVGQEVAVSGRVAYPATLLLAQFRLFGVLDQQQSSVPPSVSTRLGLAWNVLKLTLIMGALLPCERSLIGCLGAFLRFRSTRYTGTHTK